ncbi:MAG: hypothetical protein SGBAC_004699 [Bacillariaceae sp.]
MKDKSFEPGRQLLSLIVILLISSHFAVSLPSDEIEEQQTTPKTTSGVIETTHHERSPSVMSIDIQQSSSYEYSLSDPPIQGSAILHLDNNEQYQTASQENQWKLLTGDGGRILDARVPGDLLTDLVNDGVWEEPYFENHFQDNYFCSDEDGKPSWVYRLHFNVTTDFLLPKNGKGVNYTTSTEIEGEVLLVLDGIKMGARVDLNKHKLGVVTDQFLRYRYRVKDLLNWNTNIDADAEADANVTQESTTTSNVLTVTFDSSILTDGRFAACSGGWDWAPFSDCPLTQDTHSHQFSKGITKSVYLTRVSSAAITSIVPQVYYMGDYPTQALRDGEHAGFEVEVTIHLWSPPGDIKGRLNLYGSWGSNETLVVEWMGGDTITTLSITASAKDIKLWWPNGMGARPHEVVKRPLYDVRVEFVPDPMEGLEAIAIQDSRRIGFRHFALVTGNDTDPEYVQNATGQEGTDFTGMYYRVNGVAMWSRGANMIPMDALEGRLNAEAHVQVVQSAALANMNTLRVWGGGMFLPSVWYDACDDYGIMVIQDQMYAQGGHDPKETQTQELEIRHNVRLLSNHPSIVIWDGCNECLVEMDKPSSIYATFVMRVVAEEDGSRSIWPSCPSNGWESGVDKLTSRPIPYKNLVTPKTAPRRIEVHGPYIHGGGFPAVNGDDTGEPGKAKLPISIDPKPEEMGVAQPSVFASEFGTGGVMSSFESMSATLASEHWSLHGGGPPDTCSNGFNRKCEGKNVMAQRNYPCDSIIKAYFQTEPDYFDKVGETQFQRQLYHCMIGQALHMKSIIEERRSKNELGHLVWQLNEIWPTGGWGSLEYGNGDMPGQVVGGRWKPLHYFYRQSIFADVMATCNGEGVGYIRNDAAGIGFDGSVVIHVVSLANGELSEAQMDHKNITLSAGPGALQIFDCPMVNESTQFLSIDILMHGRDLIVHNTPILLTPPKELTSQISCDSGLSWSIMATSMNVVTLKITASVPVALLVMLTTQAPGRFSDNAFTLTDGGKIVQFHPFGNNPVDINLLKATLRIEDMAMYQYGQCQ